MNVAKHIKTLGLIADGLEAFAGAKVASVVLHKGIPVSFGFNKSKSHPFAAKYARRDGAIFLHAEADAIHKARKKLSSFDLSRSTIITARIKYDGRGRPSYGISKPCEGCMRCIEDSRIATVVYTENCSLNEMKFTTIIKGV
jgi:deoxycytidylate deaminase